MKILITGITGTIGTKLCEMLIENNEIVGLSRDEFKQHHFKFKNHKNLKLKIGDVRSLDDCIDASKDCDLIIHTAALKHVEKMEANPKQAIETNINGTLKLLSAQSVNNVKKLVLLSTDKAVLPVNTYGHTKAIAEKLVLHASPFNIVVRYGNVINSRGSVLESFIPSIMKNFEVNITHKNMTRFFITIEDAANFIINTTFSKMPGGLYIPEMKAMPITLLAELVGECVADFMGVSPIPVKFNVIGIRPGEKLHECLSSKLENEEKSLMSNKAELFPKHLMKDIIFRLLEGYK